MLIPYEKRKLNVPRGPHSQPVRHSARAQQPLAWPTRGRPARETARGRGVPRTFEILQKRHQTPPNLQLSTNTIFSSLRTSHLTPWPFPNSPARTSGDSVHGGVASGGTERLHRPPRTYAGPPNGSITISDPSGYAKRWCRVT